MNLGYPNGWLRAKAPMAEGYEIEIERRRYGVCPRIIIRYVYLIT